MSTKCTHSITLFTENESEYEWCQACGAFRENIVGGVWSIPDGNFGQSGIMTDIGKERKRQNDLKKAGKFAWTNADSSSHMVCLTSTTGIGAACRMAVLSEEVGEVARHVCETMIQADRYQPRELKKELIQVAAVAVAWIEAIDKELEDRLETAASPNT